MRAIILLAVLIVVYSAPSPPMYPVQFEQDFSEVMISSILQYETQGKFFYDYTNKRYRIDRDSGVGDRFCQTVHKLADTPCSHIVVEGKRYLYFPEKNDCCYCCDDAHGCGVLTPDWAKDAEYIGTVTNAKGVKLEKWNKVGGQDNFIYVTQDTNIIVQIDQIPDDLQAFSAESFYKGIRDPSVFNLPAGCSAQNICPSYSLCQFLRD